MPYPRSGLEKLMKSSKINRLHTYTVILTVRRSRNVTESVSSNDFLGAGSFSETYAGPGVQSEISPGSYLFFGL